MPEGVHGVVLKEKPWPQDARRGNEELATFWAAETCFSEISVRRWCERGHDSSPPGRGTAPPVLWKPVFAGGLTFSDGKDQASWYHRAPPPIPPPSSSYLPWLFDRRDVVHRPLARALLVPDGRFPSWEASSTHDAKNYAARFQGERGPHIVTACCADLGMEPTAVSHPEPSSDPLPRRRGRSGTGERTTGCHRNTLRNPVQGDRTLRVVAAPARPKNGREGCMGWDCHRERERESGLG